MSEFKVIGVDFSLNGTGLAVYTENHTITNQFVYSLKKSDRAEVITIPKIEEQADKIDWVCNSIAEIAIKENVSFVCMEDHTGSYYSWMDGYAVLKHLFRQANIPYIAIAPTSLKKYVISGKADKNQMAYQLRKEYGLDFDYLGECADNIVDASWLAIFGKDYYSKYILGRSFPKLFPKERVASLEKILKGKNNKWQISKQQNYKKREI